MNEPECCHVVGRDCEAPGVILVGRESIMPRWEGVTHRCPFCGQFVCDACSDNEGVCVDCGEESET